MLAVFMAHKLLVIVKFNGMEVPIFGFETHVFFAVVFPLESAMGWQFSDRGFIYQHFFESNLLGLPSVKIGNAHIARFDKSF